MANRHVRTRRRWIGWCVRTIQRGESVVQEDHPIRRGASAPEPAPARRTGTVAGTSGA